MSQHATHLGAFGTSASAIIDRLRDPATFSGQHDDDDEADAPSTTHLHPMASHHSSSRSQASSRPASRAASPHSIGIFDYYTPDGDDETRHLHPTLHKTIRAANCNTGGTRKLYMIVFRRFFRITDLEGVDLLTCWWDTVKCHLALWRNGVRHRDISANNLMYKCRDNKCIGVLNDYDLATTKDHVIGNQHMGVVPFMALDLLTKDGLAGKVKHLYAHDAESFMWVLLWISLRYEKGTLRLDSCQPFDKWLKVDAVGYGEKKSGLLTTTLHRQTAAKGQEHNFIVACKCLLQVKKRMYEEMENSFEFKEPEESASEDEESQFDQSINQGPESDSEGSINQGSLTDDVDKVFQRLFQVSLFELLKESRYREYTEHLTPPKLDIV